MPQNLCNQSCSFCSYRLPDNKNSEVFDDRSFIPWYALLGVLEDLKDLGVKGIELTGGGEPLIYPAINDLLLHINNMGFALGLVTNGTAYRRVNCWDELNQLRWVRVSIDAAKPKTYSTMRRTTEDHFWKAWEMVDFLRKNDRHFHKDFKLGVGFVLSNENINEVYDFTAWAQDNGADNVRLSSTFSDQHLDYFNDRKAVDKAVTESIRAEHRFDNPPDFSVHNLLPTRIYESEHPHQDYKRCPTKDILCVIEGTGKVYTCCTFTGSKRGILGNISDPGGFKEVWASSEKRRLNWDSSISCPVACLYRARNLAMNDMIDNPDQPIPETDAIHKEFI